MSNVLACRVCGEGSVELRMESDVVEYRGQSGSVALQMHACAHCGSEYAEAQDSLANKRAVMAFRKQVDGLLTGDDIRAIRRQYGISQAQAAGLFGGGPVAFSKYENDDVAHSEAMDKLLRLARASADAFQMLVEQAGMTDALVSPPHVVGSWKNAVTTTNVIVADFSRPRGGSPAVMSAHVRYEAPAGRLWK